MRKICFLVVCFSVVQIAGGQDKEFSCTVRVVDSAAEAIAGAEVAAYECFYDYWDGRIRTELVGKKRTGANGVCVLKLKVTEKRNVWVVARKEGLGFAWDYPSQFSIDPKITFMLEKPSVLAGTVVDENGEPIAAARVRALPARWSVSGPRVPLGADEPWLSTTADAKGRFSFSNFPADASADFFVSAPGRAIFNTCVTSGQSPGFHYAAGQTDVRIALPREAIIEGRVVGRTGRGIAGVKLLARPDKSAANYYCVNRTISEKDGRFTFKGVLKDTYFLQVVPPQEGMSKWVCDEVKVVARAGKTTGPVTVTVNKGAILKLEVRDRATNQPVRNTSVSVMRQSKFARQYSSYKASRTDKTGVTRIRVPYGECNIHAGGGGYASYQESYAVEGRNPRLRILLDHGPAVVGTVRNEKGQPLEGVTVAVVPPGYYLDRTDAEGKFKISYRRHSEFRYVFARDEQRNLTATVKLEEDGKPSDIRLKPALTLTGRVIDPNGVPIRFARIQLSAGISNWAAYIGEEVYTDEQGRYEITAVSPEQEDFTYRIKAEASGYGPSEWKRGFIKDMSAKQVEIETFVLPRVNMSVSGLVVDSEGKAVGGVPLFLTGPRGSNTSGQPRRQAVTKANGEFFINHVCKGPLRIQAGWARGEMEPGYIDAEGGDTNVKIILGERGVHSKHTSLVGKALPKLSALNVRLVADEVKDKIILVCFWDMNQRPSRNCVQRLNKRAKLLEKKGVKVVLAHCGEVDERTLNGWLNKSQIALSVGRVTGNIQQIHDVWGVQSLPWLVLADRNHVVIAEGFGVRELNEKIKELTDKELPAN